MKDLSSDRQASILNNSNEAVKNFSWETVRLELYKKVPTLMSLLSHIVRRPTQHIPFLCMVTSQLLKSRHQRLCLVQQAVSVTLYGNGTAKQVWDQCCDESTQHLWFKLACTFIYAGVLQWRIQDLKKGGSKKQYADVAQCALAHCN